MLDLKLLFVAPLVLSQALSATAFGVPVEKREAPSAIRSEGVIAALLRKPNVGRSELSGNLLSRQSGTCDPGYLPCSDGDGCCPVGKYCGVWGGKPGCCTIGKTCVANNNPCSYEGYVPCAGEDFCCPAGDTCSRSATGERQCWKPGSGNGGGSPTFTPAFSSPALSSPAFSSPAFSSPANTGFSNPAQNTVTTVPTTTGTAFGSSTSAASGSDSLPGKLFNGALSGFATVTSAVMTGLALGATLVLTVA